jgi:repressor LexA|tara:strand:+ start:254 stop:865 length:612 start_codon:yes stop_codon:yes gene_type:complete
MYLTKRQKEIVDYLRGYISRYGYAPTFDEIASSFGFTSKGTVYKHIRALKEKGVIQHQWNKARSIELRPEKTSINSLEILGTVAAGKPIEAIPDLEAMEVPSSFLKRGKHYVLKVYGDSMIEDHIQSGDFVIVQEKVEASNGQTVVALIEYNEVTIKKFFRDKDTIELRPANKQMKPMVYNLDKVKIQGVVVGVMRKYNGDFK